MNAQNTNVQEHISIKRSELLDQNGSVQEAAFIALFIVCLLYVSLRLYCIVFCLNNPLLFVCGIPYLRCFSVASFPNFCNPNPIASLLDALCCFIELLFICYLS